MARISDRLERRIRRDFPWPGSAHGVLRLLRALPARAGYDAETLASERVQAAIVLLAGGDLGRLRQALDLAAVDWRDLLVAAGLADDDWPGRLDRELGPPPPRSGGRDFDDLGFAPAYTCQVDPELPGDGRWDCPVHAFSQDGHPTAQPFRSRWGTPLIARFEMPGQDTWAGTFESGGSGGLDGMYACPDPLAALAVCGGRAYLIDVRRPDRTITIPLDPITQVRGAGSGLIVMASFDTLTAIGPCGQAWTSHRLCLDSLRIATADASGIECLGDFPDGVDAFTVAASTGDLFQGRRLHDTRPGP